MSLAAAERVPLRVLERVVAVPYELDGDALRVAVAEPADVHAIEELRLATRHRLELAVAAREDIVDELRRLRRAEEAIVGRAAAPTLTELGLASEMRERLEAAVHRLARASRRRSTQRFRRSIGPRSTSSRSRTPSSTASPA